MPTTSRIHKAILITTLPFFALFLSSCEEETAASIESAQECLNEMRSTLSSTQLATKAAECRTLLGTATSEKGFIVECASYFLEEGFFGSKLLEAVNRINDSANGNNDSLNLLSTFAFSTTANATSAQTACAQTGSTSLSAFGDMASASTFIGSQFTGGLATLLAGGTPSVDDFKTALANIDTAAEFETLGTTISSIGTTLCSSGTTTSTDGLTAACSTLNAVTASSSNAVIGECITECMSGTTASGSTCSADSSITCP